MLKLWAFVLKSEKWSIIKDRGVEEPCPMVKRTMAGPTRHSKSRHETPADKQMRDADEKHKSPELPLQLRESLSIPLPSGVPNLLALGRNCPSSLSH